MPDIGAGRVSAWGVMGNSSFRPKKYNHLYPAIMVTQKRKNISFVHK
jgi:hypothetical protein